MSKTFEAFTPEQRRALSAVLDEIIPPSRDGRLPGAGALGLAEGLEDKIRAQPVLQPAVVGGLDALAALASEAGAESFADVPAHERVDLLNRLAADAPAFLPSLIFQTYTTYYHQAEVLEGLGIPGRAPHPEGYPVAASDESLLDAVRTRGPVYRQP